MKIQNLESADQLNFGSLVAKPSEDVTSAVSDSEVAGYCCSSSSCAPSCTTTPEGC